MNDDPRGHVRQSADHENRSVVVAVVIEDTAGGPLKQPSAESARKVAAAEATESLFTNQMAAFKASPDVYSQRAYLQTLARNGSGARKFIRILTNAPEVYQLNLEDKIRDDFLNVPLPAPKTK